MNGAFKPLLPFGSQTVAEACIVNLQHAGVEEIIVVTGHRAAEMRARLAHLNVRFAFNEDAESEMSASIACGVSKLSDKAGAVLITLVDQPAIPASAIQKLITAWRQEKSALAVPQWEDQTGHPVLIDLNFGREKLLHLDPQKGLRALFDTHRDLVRQVPVDSQYVVRDIDTWSDYCTLYKDVFDCLPPALPPSEPSADEV